MNYLNYKLIMMKNMMRMGFGTIQKFTELSVLSKYLEINKYTCVLVYFTAKWNPACKITDEHIDLVSNQFD